MMPNSKLRQNGFVGEEQEEISVDSWRKNKNQILALPSGQVVEVKKIALFELMVQGDIPEPLVSMTLKAINAKQLGDLTKDQFIEYEKMINIVVKSCVVNPPVVLDSGTQDAIGVREIDWIDRCYIFEWANGGAKALNSFR